MTKTAKNLVSVKVAKIFSFAFKKSMFADGAIEMNL